jgi:hypothetical protein
VECHFVLCSLNFDVKICTKKVKLYYKWDKSGIPLDTRNFDSTGMFFCEAVDYFALTVASPGGLRMLSILTCFLLSMTRAS